jgi:D-threo-aldose 1-dehydrogenase
MTSSNRRLGRLSLGTGSLGGLQRPISAATFCATIDAAWDSGIRYFDTAPIYGLGVAEQRLGASLMQRPREEFILSTKIGRLLRQPNEPTGSAELDHGYDQAWHDVPRRKLVVDFSAEATLRSIDESLGRLGLDRIDIVYIHDTFEEQHYRAAMKGAYPALERLRREGTIGSIGVGIGRIETLRRFAQDGDFDYFLVAGRYTLLDHEGAGPLLTACTQRNISIVLGGVFNSGILADPYSQGASFDYRPADIARIARARHLESICRDHGVSLKAAALQFPLAHPAVETVLLGSSSPEEISENVSLAGLELPATLWSDLRAAQLISADMPTPSAAP